MALDEFSIIKEYFLPLTKGCKSANFLQDDCAIISSNKDKELVISKDLISEDIHFSKESGAYNIAAKLLKTNLSDLASNGAKPLYYMLGFSQKNLDENFIKEFCRGLKVVGDEFNIALIGGDSIKVRDGLCFSITIFGEATKGHALKRNQAQKGDLIFVSGYIGDAFLGLQILQNKVICNNKAYKKYLIDRHLQPKPKVILGMELVKKQLSKCAIDVSDGFLADLQHIAQTSKLDAIIDQQNIPISKAAQYCLEHNQNIALQDLISGGDDYELIFTAQNHQKIQSLAKKLSLNISWVGEFKKSTSPYRKIQLLDQQQNEVKISKYGYQHY